MCSLFAFALCNNSCELTPSCMHLDLGWLNIAYNEPLEGPALPETNGLAKTSGFIDRHLKNSCCSGVNI